MFSCRAVVVLVAVYSRTFSVLLMFGNPVWRLLHLDTAPQGLQSSTLGQANNDVAHVCVHAYACGVNGIVRLHVAVVACVTNCCSVYLYI